MTDDELRELVAANSRAIGRLEELQAENARQWQQQREENRASREESARQREESARQREESARQWEESARQWEEENARQREESARQREESARQWEEENARQREESARRWEQHEEKHDRIWKEIQASRKECERLWEEVRASRVDTDRVITSIEKRLDAIQRELGGIGRTLGGVSEGLCVPAVARIMRERFHMTQIGHQVEARRNGRSIELDVLGHANDRIHRAYVAEIKTTLSQEAIDQLHHQLQLFPEFFPHHRGKELYGIPAAVNAPAKLQEKVLKDGIYLVRASADVFELCEPEGFQPRVFPNA